MQKKEMDKTGKIIIKICIFFIVLSLTSLVLSFIFNKWIDKDKQVSKSINNDRVVIIDAGHGGIDGGASAPDGTKESDLNLALALCLGDMLESQGVNVVYTRTDDVSLISENGGSTRKMKDMTKRLEIIKNENDPILISIHMNKFTQEKYSGVQVFYSPNNEESVSLAKAVQGNIKQFIQNENSREIKNAGSHIYLLNNIDCVGILVECGFLSNPSECEKLKDGVYRKKIASVICLSVVEFLEQM